MIDLAKLATHLADARYAKPVAEGYDALVAEMANQAAPNATALGVVARAAVRRAIGSAARSLTAVQLSRLQILMADEMVDFGDPVIVAEIQNIITDAAAQARLVALATRPQSFAQAAGAAALGELISATDVQRALRPNQQGVDEGEGGKRITVLPFDDPKMKTPRLRAALVEADGTFIEWRSE